MNIRPWNWTSMAGRRLMSPLAASGRATHNLISTSYSRLIYSKFEMGWYEYGFRNDQYKSIASLIISP
jgi:hypothetical protein